MRLRCGHIGHVHEFHVEDQVGFRGNSRMAWTMLWNVARSIGHLPGDKQAALATDLHADKALVKARNRATSALSKWHGLRIAQFRFAVVAQHRLAVLVF
jgi:hypothetical protein